MMNRINFKHINHKPNIANTIIFLHEGLGCIETWKDYPEQLCEVVGMKGLVYDRPGYGKSHGDLSDRSNEYLIEAAHDLHQFITNLKLDNIILYGHSDGASIALAYGAIYPKTIKAIISEAAHVIVEEMTLKGIQTAIKAFNDGKLDGLQKYHGNKYSSVFSAWAETWLRPDFNLKTLRNLLTKIKAPSLIIQGDKDQYGSKKQVDILENEISKSVSKYILNCGHTPFLDQNKDVLKISSEYLNELFK
ncbi:MAG: alpha/beta fold hydrolase [Crocinitomicaceae bacterium]